MLSLYEKFCAYTNLPIRIDWVCDQIIDDCDIDEVLFIPAEIDMEILLGMHRLMRVTKEDGTQRKVLHVYYNAELEDHHALKRLVCCKELLHAYDAEAATAESMEAVNRLIEGIVVPPSSGMTSSLASDHNGNLHALIVLLPRDALDKLIPEYEAGNISVEDVARLAQIPEAYARLGLSPIWKDLVEHI